MTAIATLVKDGITHRYNEVAVASGSSKAVLVESYKDISVTVIPGVGGATVKTTTDTKEMIIASTARWTDWVYGSVVVNTTRILDGIIAIMLTNDDAINVSEIVIIKRSD